MNVQFNFWQLRQLIEAHFDLEDLHSLCFDLDISYDELGGDRLSAKTVALVEYMRKTGGMPRLLSALAAVRPALDWPNWEPVEDTTVTISPFPQLPTSPSNPFGHIGRIQDPAAYLIRQPLTDAIMHELQKSVSLSIVGPSQTGKSSLLWHITQLGPQQMGLPPRSFIYLSMELVHSEEDFFDYICAELDIETARGFRLARQLKGRKIILCLDEIEKMTWEGFSWNVRTELRGLADGPEAPFTLVIASRSPLGRLFPDSPEMTSPLAGLCMEVTMPPFSLQEARALAEQYLRESAMLLPEEEIYEAWRQTEGHPRQLQVALKIAFTRLWERDADDG